MASNKNDIKLKVSPTESIPYLRKNGRKKYEEDMSGKFSREKLQSAKWSAKKMN